MGYSHLNTFFTADLTIKECVEKGNKIKTIENQQSRVSKKNQKMDQTLTY